MLAASVKLFCNFRFYDIVVHLLRLSRQLLYILQGRNAGYSVNISRFFGRLQVFTGKSVGFFSVKQVSIFQKVLELTLLIIPYF